MEAPSRVSRRHIAAGGGGGAMVLARFEGDDV